MEWQEIGFILKSKNRLKVLELLNEKPQNPSSIAKTLDDHRSTISKIVGELERKGMAKCLTPEDKTFRLYRITKKGKETLECTPKMDS